MFALAFGFFFFMIFLVLGFFVGFYVLYSLGLYTLAKNQGLEDAWLAWIPVVNRYLLGELTGDEMWGVSNSKWILCLGPFLCALLAPIFIGFFLEIAYTVYYFMVLYRLYQTYADNRKDLYIITSIIFRFLIPIWIFIIRNNKPTEPVELKEETAEALGQENPGYDIDFSSPAYTSTQDLPKSDHSIDHHSDDLAAAIPERPEPFDAQAPESKESVEPKAASIETESQSDSSNVDVDAINKSISNIEEFAQKAHDEAPGKKPIELRLEKGPEVHFPEDLDNGGE